MTEWTECPLCGMGHPHLASCPAPIIEYGNLLVTSKGVAWTDARTALILCGFDEPFPMNLSRYFWLLSGQSQRTFEAEVLAWGKN